MEGMHNWLRHEVTYEERVWLTISRYCRNPRNLRYHNEKCKNVKNGGEEHDDSTSLEERCEVKSWSGDKYKKYVNE
jgi:hypothetical protein